MGYTTDFYGKISVEPPLSQEEVNFLQKFNETRRMKRTNGPYYVDGAGFSGQDHEADVINYNGPPDGQPSLWCQWRPTNDGMFIEWDGGEKFYESAEWMKYIIDHFIKPDSVAKDQLPFLQGHFCNGIIDAQGEERDDTWRLIVKENIVSTASALGVNYGLPQLV